MESNSYDLKELKDVLASISTENSMYKQVRYFHLKSVCPDWHIVA
jgi:hypothetical protein